MITIYATFLRFLRFSITFFAVDTPRFDVSSLLRFASRHAAAAYYADTFAEWIAAAAFAIQLRCRRYFSLPPDDAATSRHDYCRLITPIRRLFDFRRMPLRPYAGHEPRLPPAVIYVTTNINTSRHAALPFRKIYSSRVDIYIRCYAYFRGLICRLLLLPPLMPCRHCYAAWLRCFTLLFDMREQAHIEEPII